MLSEKGLPKGNTKEGKAMTETELKQLAFDNILPLEPLTMPQELFYYKMVNIYNLHRKGALMQSTAAGLANQAVMQLKFNTIKYNDGIEAQQRFGELYKRIELAATAYRKERTLENADRLLEVLYGL